VTISKYAHCSKFDAFSDATTFEGIRVDRSID
jgi:hypothetical protein